MECAMRFVAKWSINLNLQEDQQSNPNMQTTASRLIGMYLFFFRNNSCLFYVYVLNKKKLISTIPAEIELHPISMRICEKPTQLKKIPHDLPVTALKMVCSRLFGVPTERLVLRHKSKQSPFPEELEDGRIDISGYMIKSGSIILVDEK